MMSRRERAGSERARRPVLTLTKKDFDVSTFSTGGRGGQRQDHTNQGVRITHRASGVSAEGREHRSQAQNRQAAFQRLAADPRFRAWLSVAADAAEGVESPEDAVERTTVPENLRVEVRDASGRWTLWEEQ